MDQVKPHEAALHVLFIDCQAAWQQPPKESCLLGIRAVSAANNRPEQAGLLQVVTLGDKAVDHLHQQVFQGV